MTWIGTGFNHSVLHPPDAYQASGVQLAPSAACRTSLPCCWQPHIYLLQGVGLTCWRAAGLFGTLQVLCAHARIHSCLASFSWNVHWIAVICFRLQRVTAAAAGSGGCRCHCLLPRRTVADGCSRGAGSTSAWPAMHAGEQGICCGVAAAFQLGSTSATAHSLPESYRTQACLQHCASKMGVKTESRATPTCSCAAAPGFAACA